MTSTMRGWRKWSIIFLALLPMLTGITLVNLIPMGYNFWASFTDLDRLTHNGQVNRALNRVNTIDYVGLQNYQALFAELVTPDAVNSFVKLFLVILPIFVAYVVTHRMSRQLPRPDTRPIWLGGLALMVILWLILEGGAALDLLAQNSFFVVVVRSALYVVFCMPLFLLVGFVLALILNNPDIRFKPVWRTLLILPWAVPTYITALIWQFFFRTDDGTVNQLLRIFGISPVAWYDSPLLAFIIIVLVNVWMSYPFFTTIILTALQSIPADMYEAAEVDGASWWVRTTQITVPMLRPAVLPATVLSSITTFQMFNTVWLITTGGPVTQVGKPGGTDLVMTWAYSQVFKHSDLAGIYGTMGAFSTVIFLILLVATLLSLRVTNVTRSAYE